MMSNKTDRTDAIDTKSSKQTRTQEEQLAAICQSLSTAGDNLAELLDATGAGSRTDVALARLEHQGGDDVVLICDITLVSKQGEIAKIRSENTLPGALEPHMLTASHGNFCNMLDAVITNPLVSSFQAYLSKKARLAKGTKNNIENQEFDDQDFTGLLGGDE